MTKKRNDTEFEEWFLRYRPADSIEKKQEEKKTKSNKKTKIKSNKHNYYKLNKTKKRGRGGLFI